MPRFVSDHSVVALGEAVVGKWVGFVRESRGSLWSGLKVGGVCRAGINQGKLQPKKSTG